MRSKFNQAGAVGVIYDQPPWELPPQAWSDSTNIRFRDGAAEAFDGQSQVFGTPLGPAYRVMPVSTGREYFWVYTGINNIWATDGGAHADITSVSNSYSATDNLYWNGGAFNNFLVLNNGREAPASWSPNLANQTTPLANWEAGLKADVIRPFKNYLFALRCEESGVYNPRLLRHSNGATIGSLPSSWDYTDPNEDTGRVEFGQTTDSLVDALPLRDSLVIYKQNYTWAAQYVGGVDNPFIYRQVFAQAGMLSEWCAAAFEGKHVVLTTDDLIVHDLNQSQSIVDKRMRRWLFSQINPSEYKNCFVVPNFKNREIWVCFPTSGETFPQLALVWNWAENTTAVREIGFECPHMNWGIVNPGTGTTFDADTGSFSEGTGAFDGQAFNPVVTSILMTDPAWPRLVQTDDTGTLDGVTFTKRLTREALPFDDFLRYKRILRVFPKLISVSGETFNIFIGTRDTFEDDVVWSQPETYTVGTDAFVNFRESGRIIDLRIEYNGTQNFRLHGFDIEWDADGLY